MVGQTKFELDGFVTFSSADGKAVSSQGDTAQATMSVDLQVTDVTRTFAGVKALTDVSFKIQHGEIVGLIGPNGAGKTTLFNCITGFLRPDTGQVTFRGQRIDRLVPHQIAKLGVVRTFQSIRMFQGLTVTESILVAQHSKRRVGVLRALTGVAGARAEMAHMRRRTIELLDLVGLRSVANMRCDRLAFLEQRKVEVARALATDPAVLLLDEPSAGASTKESDQLVEVVRQARQGGRSMLLVEHNMPFVMALADRIVVLNFGQVVAVGTPHEIRNNSVVQEIYLGS